MEKKPKLPKDPRDSSSTGKNARRMERLAESVKGVIMHFTKVCKQRGQRKKTSQRSLSFFQ